MDYSLIKEKLLRLIFTWGLKRRSDDIKKIYSILSKKADPEYYSMLEKQEYPLKKEVVASNLSNPRPVKQKQVTEEDNEDLTMQKKNLQCWTEACSGTSGRRENNWGTQAEKTEL